MLKCIVRIVKNLRCQKVKHQWKNIRGFVLLKMYQLTKLAENTLQELMFCPASGAAVGLAVALAANSLIETLFDNHYWFQVRRLELRAKVSTHTVDELYWL